MHHLDNIRLLRARFLKVFHASSIYQALEPWKFDTSLSEGLSWIMTWQIPLEKCEEDAGNPESGSSCPACRRIAERQGGAAFTDRGKED